MSGDGFAAKRRSEKAIDAPDERSQRTLLDELKSQAGSMTGMAGMFIVTILLAMKIQPFYDRDELRAFGAEGATKAGFILLELVFIFIFTALIIYLARKNMQKFIRWGILGVLWIAMLYALYPLAAMVLVPDAPPFTEDAVDTSEAYIIAVEEGGANFFYADVDDYGNQTLRYVGNAGEIEHWSHNVIPENEGNLQKNVQISRTVDGIIMCEGTQWILLDAEDGTPLDDHGLNCDLGLRYEYTDTMDETCDGIDDVPQDWRISDRAFEPIQYYHDGDPDPESPMNTQACMDWARTFPSPFNGANILFVQEIGTEHFLIVSEQWAGMVEYPTGPTGQAFGGEVTTTWNMSLSGGELFTGATFGAAPGLNVSAQDSLILSTSAGHISSWEISDDGTVKDGFSMDLSETVRGVLLADCCSGGSNDLWVIEGDNLRIFMGGNLVEMPRSLDIGGNYSRVLMALHNVDNNETALDDGILLIEQGGDWSSMHYTVHIYDYTMTTYVSLILAITLLVVLIRQPQWYVINTVGILVGAGTITMLGVSFVPWIIILFMVLAAVYDAWAVYSSKHMLELADTMVNLELPVMLVAPQKPAHGRVQMVRQEDGSPPQKRNFDETMLMGLGDVIFPGLLCVSAMTWLPDVSGPMGFSAPIWVAIGTMIGSLVGYCILMTYVARGRPQAGLPLLNGGAIIGYFISAAIFIGSSAFVFDISLF
ncbi:MAG: presenilin family intramembrane aspartyl protease [Candidatus Poseidoniales archaeon]|nr:presenilin family intramembrane aspartyl protease [Candidatus Poseidoniales archaeon]